MENKHPNPSVPLPSHEEISSDLIFQLDNKNALIMAAINRNSLQNTLSNLIAEKIRPFFLEEIEIDVFCSRNETKLIQQIVKLFYELKFLLKTKTSEKKHHVCEKIFKLIYGYLLYRVNGIQEHLNSGMPNSYKKTNDSDTITYLSSHWGEIHIHNTFEIHCSKNRKEIAQYLNKNAVKAALALLQAIVPNLFLQQQTLEEYLLDKINPFSEPGICFGEPPFTNELLEFLKSLSDIYRNNFTVDTVSCLETIVKKLEQKDAYAHILELVYKIYTPMECLSYWPDHALSQQWHINFLRLCLSIGLYFPEIISYDLLEVSEEKIKKAIKTLSSKDGDIEDKITAGRILNYAQIPWYLIQNISALLAQRQRVNRPQDEQMIFAAQPELTLAWQSLLPLLQDLIIYEINVATGRIDFSKIQYVPVDKKQYFLLTCLGNYAGDVLFLHKITSVLSELDFQKPFWIETYLRLLGIFGESAKNFSPFTKRAIGENYCHALAKVRDRSAHTTGFLRRLQRALQEDTELCEGLKADFQLLFQAVQLIQKGLPNCWEEIKDFYMQDLSTVKSCFDNLGEGLNRILEIVDGVVTVEDRKELYLTKQYCVTDIEKKRDQVVKILNKEVAAKDINQNDFFSLVDELPLTKNQKKGIKEIYKNLRLGKKVTATASFIQVLNEIKSTPDNQLDKRIGSLIKEIKNFTTPEALEKELEKIGLLEAKAIWETKRKKYLNQSIKSIQHNKKDVERWSLEKILSDSVNSANRIIEHLKILNQLTRRKGSKTLLPVEEFWKNPILCHAVEFHFTRIRIYVDVIQEALDYLPRFDVPNEIILALNDLYRTLVLELEQIRLYGNSLAHLHDVTKIDGRTIYGHRLTAYQALWKAIEGYQYLSSLDASIKFYAKQATDQIAKRTQERSKKIQKNRQDYEIYAQLQKQALAQLPDMNVSDYQILTTFNKIDSDDSHRTIKEQLYTVTKTLFRLHQEFTHLLNSRAIFFEPEKQLASDLSKSVHLKDTKILFEEIPIEGDGWCTLNAIGIEPVSAIEELRSRLNDPMIINYLRKAIENNYQASLSFEEEFDIEGVDDEGNSIKDKIIALYLNCQNAISNNAEQIYWEMMSYLGLPIVQNTYLNYLLKTRYVDSNIAAACLYLQGKKLALLADYHLPHGELINLTQDDVLMTDPTTVSLIFHPSDRQTTAHYNLLKIKNIIKLKSQTAVPSVFHVPLDENKVKRDDLHALLKEAKVFPLLGQDKEIVKIVFFSLNKATQFQIQLFSMGIVNLSMPNEPRKMDVSQDGFEFSILLAADEYNAIAGGNAFEQLMDEKKENLSYNI